MSTREKEKEMKKNKGELK